jgi:hypothetical protein
MKYLELYESFLLKDAETKAVLDLFNKIKKNFDIGNLSYSERGNEAQGASRYVYEIDDVSFEVCTREALKDKYQWYWNPLIWINKVEMNVPKRICKYIYKWFDEQFEQKEKLERIKMIKNLKISEKDPNVTI